jgi:putative hydrolase of the HAD superfamily
MAVFFDLDDTLLDDAAAVRAGALALRAIADPVGTPEGFIAAWGAAAERHFERFIGGEIDFQGQRRARIREVIDASIDDRGADAMFDVYLSAHEAAWSLHTDALGCLDALARHALAIVSNGQGEQQRRKIERVGIADRFECIAISGELGHRKPDASIFLHACDVLGADPRDCIHVGDRYVADALGARSAGLIGVWLDRDGRRTPDHDAPIVSTLGELVVLVGSVCPA